MDARGLAAWRAFLEAHAAVVRTLEDQLERERNLPLTWYDVLLHLSEAPNWRLRMRELSDRLVITQGGVTRLVGRMEAAGLVRRVAVETDGRGTFAAMTRRGHRALREAAPVHLRGIREHFLRHVSPEEADVLAKTLGRVLHAARAGSEPARPGDTGPA